MVGTVIGLVIGALVTVISLEKGTLSDLHPVSTLLLFFPAALICIYFLMYSWALPPLQKAEQDSSPRILEMFKKDPLLGFTHLGLILIPLAALTLGVDIAGIHFIPPAYALGMWVALIGASLDLLIQFIKRILSYLNPFAVAQLFRQAANRSIQNDKEAELCEWIDALSEVGSRALDKGGSTLCNEVLNELYEIARLFLGASKSIGHVSEDKESAELGIKDKITFTLFYLFQRLELLFNKGLEKKLETVCSSVLTVFGKITIEAAKFDMSLASFPLQYIGKLSLEGQQQKLQDIGVKATCLYIELSKSLVNEIDITYLELQEPFFTLIHNMDQLAKEAFKQNKEIPIKVLIQPFRDLKTIFSEGKVAAHQDTPVILSDIDRVIAEFDALEMVLRTIPPISSLTRPSLEEEVLPEPEQKFQPDNDAKSVNTTEGIDPAKS